MCSMLHGIWICRSNKCPHHQRKSCSSCPVANISSISMWNGRTICNFGCRLIQQKHERRKVVSQYYFANSIPQNFMECENAILSMSWKKKHSLLSLFVETLFHNKYKWGGLQVLDCWCFFYSFFCQSICLPVIPDVHWVAFSMWHDLSLV